MQPDLILVRCPTPQLAAALNAFLASEGHTAMWWRSGRHCTLVTTAPATTVDAACLAVTHGAISTDLV